PTHSPAMPQSMNGLGRRILQTSFRTHILISALLRLTLICYGHVHDGQSAVPYTDIDYKVVTDGARHILAGESPFKRHTYRYSPIMAYLQTLNILVHPACGKLVYAAFDLLIATLIYRLVHMEIKNQYQKTVQHLLSKYNRPRKSEKSLDALDERSHPENLARAAACFWLYNPLTAVISTRGSGDCFSSFFVILTIYLLLRSAHQGSKSAWLIFGAGLAHGLVIHLRLYPLLFSLGYYLALSTSLTRTPLDFLWQILCPNRQQVCLVAGTLLSLVSLTYAFYTLYGWEYIYEAYLYHFVRKDPRHNFSLQFLLQYLGTAPSVPEPTLLVKLVLMAPQFLLILYLSLSFGQFRQTLPFCIFTVAFVIVTYNSVVTSQYFIWYLALLPLCLNNFKLLPWRKCFTLLGLWLLAQAMWLLPAYLLEFRTWNTFNSIGLQGASFFAANGYILEQLLSHYGFTQFKISFRKLM
ncbi:hypothetical protein KR018_007798, partial [Drosophila ironensis]